MVISPHPSIEYRADPNGISDLLVRAAKQTRSAGIHLAFGARADESEFLSYPALLNEARRILGGLLERTERPGAKVVLLLERARDFIPVFWACALGGRIPCPLVKIRSDSDRWAKHLAHVNALLEEPLFVSVGSELSELPPYVETADLNDLRNHAASETAYRANRADPAILMLTSGSTGSPKAVELTHGNLLASMQGRAHRQQLSSDDVTFNWIAFDHVAALLESHMIGLYVGAAQLNAEPATVLSDPLLFLKLIDHHRVSLAFAPNFLLGQINEAIRAKLSVTQDPGFVLDLSCLKRIVTGGEANVVETGRKFLELLAPFGLRRNVLWPAFGMTETCAASVYSSEFPECDVDYEFASVGFAISGMEMRIIDEAGGLCSPGATGELQVRGPVIFRRYYNNESATAAAFTDDGWFRTGDVGRLENGRLRLIARNKDSIIVNGVNYYSQELETRLEQLEGIECSYVAAFPTRPTGADTERLVVTFATAVPADDVKGIYRLLVAIRNTTIMLWGFRPVAILPLPESAFPKTSLGKTQRSLMRKRFEAGEYESFANYVSELSHRQSGPYIPPEGELEIALAGVFSKILAVDQKAVSSTASFFDLGGTSLDIIRFTQVLERQFGLKSGLPIVLCNPGVRELARAIEANEQPSSRGYDPIVTLQATGKKSPLFCVHPGNGEVFILVNLAKYFLNDRPFHALRPRGFTEGEECFESLDDVVCSYVDAIRQRQPHGPYAIAGYSMGCEIVFEIAKCLEAEGEGIGFLGCIDSPPRSKATELDFNMATGLALVTDLITLDKFVELNRVLKPELPSDEVCKYVLESASRDRLAQLDLDLAKFSRWARVAHEMEVMLLRNVAAGSVSKMTVFCSDGIPSRYSVSKWTRETWGRELNRWSKLAERCKYIDVPGDHHLLMAPRHVSTFQALLRAEIDLAMGEG